MDKLIIKNLKFVAKAKAYYDFDTKKKFFSVQIRDMRNNNIFYIPIKKAWSDWHYLEYIILHDAQKELLKEYHISDVEDAYVSKYGRWYPVIKCEIKNGCTKEEVEYWGNKDKIKS